MPNDQTPKKNNEPSESSDKKRASPFDLSHPVLKPLWVRLCLTLGCLAWVGVELAIGSAIWAALFAGMGLYMGWTFFFSKPS